MSAVLSPCKVYRYRLDRTVAMAGPVYAFFGINPSIAGPVEDDPTVRKWIGFTKVWGGSRFIVGNVHPLRSADVKRLATAPQWLDIARENQKHLEQIAGEADVLVPCWGCRKKVPRLMHNQLDQLMAWLLTTGKPVMALGRTQGGDPKHPLMLAYSTPLTTWAPGGAP